MKESEIHELCEHIDRLAVIFFGPYGVSPVCMCQLLYLNKNLREQDVDE